MSLINSNPEILVAMNDSLSSKAVIEYLSALSFLGKNYHITLLHIFKKVSGSKELMGTKFIEEEESRLMALLQKAKVRLIENGLNRDRIAIELVSEPSPSIADGIIQRFKERNFDMVVIGRKRMSSAEEFVMGDASVQLVRALEDSAVLVVKSD